jgi:hypothetical protein
MRCVNLMIQPVNLGSARDGVLSQDCEGLETDPGSAA